MDYNYKILISGYTIETDTEFTTAHVPRGWRRLLNTQGRDVMDSVASQQYGLLFPHYPLSEMEEKDSPDRQNSEPTFPTRQLLSN